MISGSDILKPSAMKILGQVDCMIGNRCIDNLIVVLENNTWLKGKHVHIM